MFTDTDMMLGIHYSFQMLQNLPATSRGRKARANAGDKGKRKGKQATSKKPVQADDIDEW